MEFEGHVVQQAIQNFYPEDRVTQFWQLVANFGRLPLRQKWDQNMQSTTPQGGGIPLSRRGDLKEID